jgi:hypothetical protein
VLLNDQLHWRGQLKGGSYCEGEAYATNIQITSRPFEFPPITASLPPITPASLPSPQSEDWLEKEAVEQQIRQLEEEERRDKVKKISSVRNTVAIKNEGEGKAAEDNWLSSPPKRERRERQAIEQDEPKQ